MAQESVSAATAVTLPLTNVHFPSSSMSSSGSAGGMSQADQDDLMVLQARLAVLKAFDDAEGLCPEVQQCCDKQQPTSDTQQQQSVDSTIPALEEEQEIVRETVAAPEPVDPASGAISNDAVNAWKANRGYDVLNDDGVSVQRIPLRCMIKHAPVLGSETCQASVLRLQSNIYSLSDAEDTRWAHQQANGNDLFPDTYVKGTPEYIFAGYLFLYPFFIGWLLFKKSQWEGIAKRKNQVLRTVQADPHLLMAVQAATGDSVPKADPEPSDLRKAILQVVGYIMPLGVCVLMWAEAGYICFSQDGVWNLDILNAFFYWWAACAVIVVVKVVVSAAKRGDPAPHALGQASSTPTLGSGAYVPMAATSANTGTSNAHTYYAAPALSGGNSTV